MRDKIADLLIDRRRHGPRPTSVMSSSRRDLPITKGLQKTIHEYRQLDVDGAVCAMLAEIATRPQLDLAVADEIDEMLPEVAGGLSLALGQTFRIIRPQWRRNPQTEQWERAFQIFDLLL